MYTMYPKKVSGRSDGSIPESEPFVCFDATCTYPFGSICKRCAFRTVVREENRRMQAEERVGGWVKKISEEADIAKNAGQMFIGGAEDRDLILTSIGSRKSVPKKSRFGDAKLERGEEGHDSEFGGIKNHPDNDLSNSITTTYGSMAAHSTTFTPRNSAANTTSIASSIYVARHSLTDHLDPSLSDLFNHTLNGQVTETPFTGGAEEKNRDLEAETCPLCYQPLGDPRNQHLLQCIYAHEEVERLKQAMPPPRHEREG